MQTLQTLYLLLNAWHWLNAESRQISSFFCDLIVILYYYWKQEFQLKFHFKIMGFVNKKFITCLAQSSQVR